MTETRTPKVLEEMTTTSSYVLTIGQVRWIEQETDRIKSLPNAPKKFNKSVLVRSLIDRAMSESDAPERQVEAA